MRLPVRLGLLLAAGLVLAGAGFQIARGLTDGGAGAYPGGRVGDEPAFEAGQEATVTGQVVENTIDPCLFPQATPCIQGGGFALRLDVGRQRVSVWYAFGAGRPCLNGEAVEQGSDARVGTTVEVRGEVESVGPVSLTTCTSPEHYIRQVE